MSAAGATLGFLATATYGPASGTGTISYSDGTTQQFTLTVPDWYAAPPSGSDPAITMTYRNRGGNVQQAHQINVYYYISVPPQAGKTVTGLTLPTVGGTAVSGRPAMHISSPLPSADGAYFCGDTMQPRWKLWATRSLLAVASAFGLVVANVVTVSAAAPPALAAQRPVFSVMDYGATGNGTTNDTSAINQAITAANATGGGIVDFPAGSYLAGGSIHMLSNVTLDLEAGSTILGAATGTTRPSRTPTTSTRTSGTATSTTP
jgi:hypothetical protein